MVGTAVYATQAPKIRGLVPIELGGDPDHDGRLPANLDTALAWDFAFIAGYGAALVIGTRLARASVVGPRSRLVARWARRGAWVVIAADCVENAFLYWSTQRPTSTDAVRDIATTAAAIKWATVIPVGLVALVGVLQALRPKRT